MEMQNTVFVQTSEQNLEEIRSKEYRLQSNKNQWSKVSSFVREQRSDLCYKHFASNGKQVWFMLLKLP